MNIALLAHVLVPVALAALPFARSYWFYGGAEEERRALIGKRLVTLWLTCLVVLPIVLGVMGLEGWPLLFITIFVIGVVAGIIGDILP